MRELIFAVKEAAQGRRYIASQLSKRMADPLFGKVSCDPAVILSTREIEVLSMVVRGKTSAYIAAKLELSTTTVETYRSRMMLKLGINNVPALVRYAIQRNMLGVHDELASANS
jgi:DNA-binding NarL/FixJ family response regulator